LALPFLFTAWGAMGIFIVAVIAQSVGFMLNIMLLVKKFDYRPQIKLDQDTIRTTWKYSAGNYISDLINIIPVAVIPILIINTLGTAHVAYYYIILMIANAIETIPSSITRSLFSEGATLASTTQHNIKKAVRLIALLLIPLTVSLFFLGDIVLTLFGKSFSEEGLLFFKVMILDCLVISVYYVYDALFRLSLNVRAILIRNACYAGSVITLAYFLLPFGLVGIGLAWLTSTTLASLLSVALYQNRKTT
jgi:O-antigen/teichoic acid export membrane protein